MGRPPDRAAAFVRTVAAFLLALVVPLLVRLPPARLGPLLTALAGSRSTRRRDEAALVASVERGLALARRLRRQSCLTRGISRFVVLRRAGVPVELAFGLGPKEGTYDGHCWLELEGRPFLERDDPRSTFPEVFRLPRVVRT